MILRSNNEEVFIFEASNDSGVTLLKWEEFRLNNWHADYSKYKIKKKFLSTPIQE